jgi:excisionase family DNA binding protein
MTTSNQYISVRESAQLLGVSERKIMDLIEGRQLTAYKIANQFLRLKKSDVLALKNAGAVAVETIQHPYTQRERIRDFFVFNDFYLASLGIILILLYVILKGN